ncbi:MAG: 4Fe-4S binding protein [Bacteroidetes bacterium]|nr:4Fe-4S binding protein [Bacteroidota bacterium]
MFGNRKNKNKNANQGRGAKISSGLCMCPQCNYSLAHKRGVPCFTLICPTCNVPLVRQAQFENNNKHIGFNDNVDIANYPKVDTELCSGCGACVNECLSGAIIIEHGKAKIINEQCVKCHACVNACPAEAIT